MSRLEDRIDLMADRLADAAEEFIRERARLLDELEKVQDRFHAELFAAERWAIEERLIDSEDWVDGSGEPFLWVGHTEVVAEIVPDVRTLFVERVAFLSGGGETKEVDT